MGSIWERGLCECGRGAVVIAGQYRPGHRSRSPETIEKTRGRRPRVKGQMVVCATDIYGPWERATRKAEAEQMEGVFGV